MGCEEIWDVLTIQKVFVSLGLNYIDHDPITLALRSLRLNKLDNLTVVV
ncbi:unnamed protein product [Brassica rapa]|uniref:Uncharacterized protein n=1 Tax=Brassica campestris TaxID=3711 RepID=A0A3P6BQB0_BRACM|nr:unnamed protein product [Brassica rapa]VDD04806.1 unnamed protein product [Brassica rapa]